MCLPTSAADPLPSWNDGAVKRSIVAFVDKVTKEGGADFVPVAERIAAFDNDGTLWCEQPMYFQMIFAFDQIKATAKDHPEWKNQEPYKFVLAGDLKAFGARGEQGLLDIMAATHAGMRVEEFHATVREWIRTARHPRFRRPYDECIYQPMHELLVYLRANRFKTFIVSGGGVEFMRPWVDKAYDIPPEQVVGSSGVVKYELEGDQPVLMKQAKVEFIDDGPGKPVGINRFIGRRPIMAFGNSDGDYEMLRWTTAARLSSPKSSEPATRHPAKPCAGCPPRPRFGLIVHHTDAEREYAYDYPSPVGQLKRALDEAPQRGWVVVDMKNDWKTVFKSE
ncbi:MAG: haloacid dehalogenase-like hydrolase [Planctomycetes bacterium]|nr:haloacid dehalogenase-like hydrolase [Planctomycetota bacterium]